MTGSLDYRDFRTEIMIFWIRAAIQNILKEIVPMMMKMIQASRCKNLTGPWIHGLSSFKNGVRRPYSVPKICLRS
jgi:hypothetical protein